MHKFFLILTFLFTSIFASATDYYLAADGNDANSGNSSSAPWKSINKLNAYFSNLRPGDRVLFRRGDSFYGTIIINRSGSNGAPITIGAYGSGSKPVISGFTTVTSWKNLGGNIWESSSTVSSLSYTNMVVVNGINTPVGRWPNNEYAIFESRSGNTSITSSFLNSGTNWEGAEIAMFTAPYRVSRNKITSHSGNVLSYQTPPVSQIWQTPGSFYIPNYVIQNSPKTLDVVNEWYYNPSSKKLQIYSVSKPGAVRVASLENLVDLGHNSHHIVFENLAFEGSAATAIEIGSSSNTTIQSCDFKYIGKTGIYGGNWGTNLPGLVIDKCTFDQINNSAIDLSRWFTGAQITNNKITNIGMIITMISGGSSSLGIGISAIATNVLIQNNVVQHTGYVGINFRGSYTIVKNNFVDNYCMGEGIKDGGGIYTWNVDPNFANTKGVQIVGNIVSNSGRYSKGIDLDDGSHGIDITGNTVVNTERGIYLHNARNVKITGNTTFDSHQMGLLISRDVSTLETNNIEIRDNVFFAKNADEQTAWFVRINSVTSPNFTSDYNYFAKPISDQKVMLTYDGPVGTDLKQYYTNPTLAEWTKASGKDKNSKKEPKSIKDVNELRFESNPTFESKTIKLDGKYIDAKSNIYNGTVTLAPFTSVVLIRDGAIKNVAPTVNAGSSSTISLPLSTASLKGSAADEDGTVVAYKWSKISGPASANFTNATEATTEVSGLTEGVYKFQLTATDNAGASANATVQVTVNAASYSMPIANAGDDQFIDLPGDKVVLYGNESSYDGKGVLSYQWSKLSGPAGESFARPTSSVTDVTGLVAGVYVFQVAVSNENGDTDKATVKLTVTQQNGYLPAVETGSLLSGLKYQYFEDDAYKVIPEFTFQAAKKIGTVSTFDNSVADRSTAFAINFEGYINIAEDGDYTFYTLSDDGSALYIDGVKVVDNDGIHYNREMSGTISLAAGMHAISVGYFQQTGGNTLQVGYSGAGISKRDIPANVLFHGVSGELLPAINAGEVTNGLQYTYFENSSYRVLPDFSTVTPKKAGIVSQFDNAVAARNDAFAISFDGYINIPADGRYTFYTLSDDGSALYIDGIKIVDNDGVHYNREVSGTIGLEAGMHQISVGYFQQSGGRLLKVSFEGPGISKREVPANILFKNVSDNLLAAIDPGKVVNGLDYEYHEASSYSRIPDFPSSVPVKTGVVSSFDNSVAERSDAFAMKFQGYIDIPADGIYTFYTLSDDGSSLYIDGIQVIDNDGIHYNRERNGEIGLKAGLHAISVGYFQQTGGRILQVSYESSEIKKTIIPSSRLYKLSMNGGGFAGRTAYMSTRPGEKFSPDLENNLVVKAYPNPFTNVLQVNVGGIKVPYKFILLDVNGRTLLSREGAGKYVETIDVSTFQKGFYFLKIIYGQEMKVVKLEKQ